MNTPIGLKEVAFPISHSLILAAMLVTRVAQVIERGIPDPHGAMVADQAAIVKKVLVAISKLLQACRRQSFSLVVVVSREVPKEPFWPPAFDGAF